MIILNKCTKILILLAIAGIAASFTIPYFFPSKIPALSASYDYGFSNKVGFVVLFTLCLLLLFIAWKGNKKTVHLPTNDNFLLIQKDHVLDNTFKVCMIFFIICYMLLWWIVRKTLGFGESGYFIPKVYELILGRKIYTEIDFAYGPLLLYFPFCIYKILSFLIGNISVQDAYFLSLLILEIFAQYSLYRIISVFNIETKLKKTVYVCIYIVMLPIKLGLNGAFRFVLPFIALYYIRNKRPTLYSFLLFFFISIIVNISPEIGIAFAFTIIVSNSIKFYLNRENVFYYIAIAIIAVAAVAIWPIVMPSMLTQFKAFLSGGLNFPFIPSFAHIVFFSSLCFLAINIGIQLNNMRQHMEILTIELLMCSMLPGALSFSEPFHMMHYSFILFVLTASFLRTLKWQRLYAFAILIFTIFTLPYTFVTYGKGYSLIMIDNNTEMFNSEFAKSSLYSLGKIFGISESKITKHLQRKNDNNNNGIQKLSSICDLSDIAAPFDVDNTIYIYLIKTNKYHYLPSRNVKLIGSKTVIDKNLNAMKHKTPTYLILPKEWRSFTEPVDYKSFINSLFITPYSRKAKHNGNEIFTETILFIDNHYDFIKTLKNNDNVSLQYQLYKLKN